MYAAPWLQQVHDERSPGIATKHAFCLALQALEHSVIEGMVNDWRGILEMSGQASCCGNSDERCHTCKPSCPCGPAKEHA